MKLTPRDYQVEAVNSIYGYFHQGGTGHPIVAMPTGTGKSIVIAMFLESVFRAYPSQRVLVLTHVKELIQQNYDELMALWPSAPAGINSAGLGKRDTHNRIVFAGIGSVARYSHLFGRVDLVLIDEAHLVSPTESTMYQRFIAELTERNVALKVIGFTATPWRLGQGHITDGGLFTDVCFDITRVDAFNRLIAEGYLSMLIPRRTQALLDTDGVHMRGGEFIPAELQRAVDREDVTRAALQEAVVLGADRKHWLVFAAGVEHAMHVSEMLEDLGVPTACVHSRLTTKERDDAISGFKRGEYRAAVNNNVLTTGFNFPGIDLIVMLRPTASPGLWVQMLGRGTRPAPGKDNCLVLDFAGNTRRLGPINDPVLPRAKGKGNGTAPVRLCDACGTYNHASARTCICCGVEFQVVTKIHSIASGAELIRGDFPEVEEFSVDHITYLRHEKVGRPPSLKVSYYCGYRVFNEFVCLEHGKWARQRAEAWWKERTAAPVPATVERGLIDAPLLRAATHVRVWTNKQPYPELLAFCFDGTKFGKSDEAAPPPTTQVHAPTAGPVPGVDPFQDLDPDDIPF